MLNKTQDLIPFTQYYCINGLAEGHPKKITQRIFRPGGVTEHASWSLNVPWSTKRNKAFPLQPFPWHTSDLQGKGLNTKGKAFLSSKQAYLCTLIKLELQAMGVATTTIFQDSDSCNYFLNQAVDVEHAGTFPQWDWPWSNTKTKQQLVQHAFVGKLAWTSVLFLRVCQNYFASSDCQFLLESSSEIARLKRAFIQAAGSANSPLAILTC